MAFLDMIGELTGVVPGLGPILAAKYVNRAYSEIRRLRDWSFLVTDGVVNCPAVIQSGAASITQYNATVTLDATASAAIASQLGASAVPGLTNLQIRFGATTQIGGIYSIIAYDDTVPAAVVLTLDRVVQEETDAASTYRIYRCYIVPPISDFRTWLALDDYVNAIAIAGPRLTLTSAQLDVRDPQRASMGLAYWLASWGANRISNAVTGATVPNVNQDNGAPIYELWPHPTQGQTFYCRFRRAGVDLVQPGDELPPNTGIDESLVVARALAYHVYPFAQANIANFPTLKGANWVALMQQARATFEVLYRDAKRIDNSTQLQDVWNRGHGLRSARPFGRFGDQGYPIDSNFLQSHLIRF